MSNNLHDLLKKDTRNLKKKNYPKSSDSSRVVRSTGIEAVSTSLKAFIYKGFSHLLAKNTPIILYVIYFDFVYHFIYFRLLDKHHHIPRQVCDFFFLLDISFA